MPSIYTIDKTRIPTLPHGAAPLPPEVWDWLAPPVWRERSEVEHDERILQPIVYLVLLDGQHRAWCYQRRGGDARLDTLRSCGVGGHVDREDAGNAATPLDVRQTLHNALLRELAEELGAAPHDICDLHPYGWIYEDSTPVGRVHLGVLYRATWCAAMEPTPSHGEKLAALGFHAMEEIAQDLRFEGWSRLAVGQLLAMGG
ncbi:NUDIX domain-containing protein [Candidatus Symbiobacter mobilis]|uniref:Phosphoesterase-like protein n=1 Tax=Candidatus Symbiobacter mobilis CR TaxID=946483 RepID=U5N6B3_9BURK|nr:NUDIX domain-containing protein [Candidatus Symbiobacter mobilis]AGX87066.1 phosphoesterase-like protein [Candidatus Symbiobacter mobilis CR]